MENLECDIAQEGQTKTAFKRKKKKGGKRNNNKKQFGYKVSSLMASDFNRTFMKNEKKEVKPK